MQIQSYNEHYKHVTDSQADKQTDYGELTAMCNTISCTQVKQEKQHVSNGETFISHLQMAKTFY